MPRICRVLALVSFACAVSLAAADTTEAAKAASWVRAFPPADAAASFFGVLGAVNGRDIYVLWNGVPSTLTGNVRVTDYYGNISVKSVASLTPTEAAPVFVENEGRRRAARH